PRHCVLLYKPPAQPAQRPTIRNEMGRFRGPVRGAETKNRPSNRPMNRPRKTAKTMNWADWASGTHITRRLPARMLTSKPTTGELAMTTAADLLADLRSRGIELETDGVRLRWRPAFMVTDPMAEQIRAHLTGLIELLTGPDRLERCPACGWPLDSKRR